MPDYGMVSNAINNLGQSIRGYQQDRMGHQERMSNLGLQGTQLGLQKAEMDRELWLAEPVTGRQAIMENPNWDDATKAAFEKAAPKKLLDLVYPRGQFAEMYSTGMIALDKAEKEAAKDDLDYKFKMADLGLKEKAYGLQAQRLGLAQDRYDNPKVTAAEANREDEIRLENFMADWDISGDFETGFESPVYSPEEAEEMKQSALDYGLRIKPEETEMEGKGLFGKATKGFTVGRIARSLNSSEKREPKNFGLAGGSGRKTEKPEDKVVSRGSYERDKSGKIISSKTSKPMLVDELTALRDAEFAEAGGPQGQAQPAQRPQEEPIKDARVIDGYVWGTKNGQFGRLNDTKVQEPLDRYGYINPEYETWAARMKSLGVAVPDAPPEYYQKLEAYRNNQQINRGR